MNAAIAYYTSVKSEGLRSRAFKPMTRQEEKYVAARIGGATHPESCAVAGLEERRGVNENIEKALDFFADTEIAVKAATRDEITGMLRESHAKAAEVRDEISAARELGKLWGLYESDRVKRQQVTINGGLNVTNNKLEVMSDTELLQHSAFALESLEPGE